MTATSQIAVRGTEGFLIAGANGTQVVCVSCAAGDVSVQVGQQTFSVVTNQTLTVLGSNPLTATTSITSNAAVNNPAVNQFNNGTNPLTPNPPAKLIRPDQLALGRRNRRRDGRPDRRNAAAPIAGGAAAVGTAVGSRGQQPAAAAATPAATDHRHHAAAGATTLRRRHASSRSPSRRRVPQANADLKPALTSDATPSHRALHADPAIRASLTRQSP